MVQVEFLQIPRDYKQKEKISTSHYYESLHWYMEYNLGQRHSSDYLHCKVLKDQNFSSSFY